MTDNLGFKGTRKEWKKVEIKKNKGEEIMIKEERKKEKRRRR